MADSQKKSDGYNHAVDQSALISIRLTESRFKVTPDFEEKGAAAKKYLHQAVGDHHYDAGSGMLLGHIHCRTWMLESEPQSDDEREEWFERAIFAVDANYVVAFDMPGGHDDESVSTFFDRMAPLACWPYFRSHVALTAAEAGIAVPVLPVKKLRFPVKEAGGYIDPEETRHLIGKEDAT